MRSSRLSNTQKEKLRHRVYAMFVLIGICVLAYFIHGINTNMQKISDCITSLDERQTTLEQSIENVNKELKNQQAITEEITTLLEQQNKIDSYTGQPAYYKGGLSDRSANKVGVSRGGTNPLVPREISPEIRIQKLNAYQQEVIEEQERKKNDFSTFYVKVSGNTDLGRYVNINEEEFNKWIAKTRCPKNSPFYNRADVFLKASEITGLDPKYIFAHAAQESGFGTSGFARNRGNYFGINAVDSNPNKAYTMGSNLEKGIINGAQWIKDHYYSKGRTTLNKMKAANYATDPAWVGNIVGIMNS